MFSDASYQTLWAAIQAMGAVIALFFIYRQIADGRRVSAYEFLRREDDRFQSDRMTQHRSSVAKMLLSRPKNQVDRDKYYAYASEQYPRIL
jgi:hypothetical protein